MAKKGSFSKVYDKNGDYVDVEAARFDGTRTVQMQGDVSATQTWNGDSASALTLNTSIGAKKVTTDKINDKAVGTAQLADDAVGLTQIDDNAMTSAATSGDDRLITSGGVRNEIDNALLNRGVDYPPMTPAQINAITDTIPTGSTVHVTEAGTITDGDIVVRAGEDLRYYRGNGEHYWYSLDGDFKLKQQAKSSPTASGSTLEFIDSISQDENGEITASKKSVRDGTTSQKGVVQLEDSHSSTSTTKAATSKNVKEAYDLANTANTGAVKNVAYDSTNKKITKTINGTTTDVVSVATLKTDMALNNVDNTSDANKPVSTAQQAALDLKLDKTGDGKDVTATFTEASTRENIGTGEKLSVIFGKIKKWFSDLGTAAFKNVPASGNASSTEVVLGSDTRLSAGASAVQDVTVDGASVVNSSTKVAAVPNASTSAKGAVQLAGSIGATVASENNKAATEKAVRDAINALDAEVTSNDGTNVQVKVTEADGKISAVNVTTDNTENKNNKVSSWQTTPDNTHYPSEKLVKDGLDAKADADSVVAIADAMIKRVGQTGSGWYKLAELSITSSYENVNYCFDVYAATDTRKLAGRLDVAIRTGNSAGASVGVSLKKLYSDAWSSDYKFKIVIRGLTGSATIELWASCLRDFGGLSISERNTSSYTANNKKDRWTYTSYTNNGGSAAPVTDETNNVKVVDVDVVYRQLAIASPTNNNIVAMDANGLVKDSGKKAADFELVENKVTSVRAASSATDTAYPSEKAVANALDGKVDKDGYINYADGKWIGAALSVSGETEAKYWKLCSFTTGGYWTLNFVMDVTNGKFDSNVFERKIIAMHGGTAGQVQAAREIRDANFKLYSDRGYGNNIYYNTNGTAITVYIKAKFAANLGQYCHLVSVVNSTSITNLTWYLETTAGTQPEDPVQFTAGYKVVKPSGSASIPVYIGSDGNPVACTDDFVHDADLASALPTTGNPNNTYAINISGYARSFNRAMAGRDGSTTPQYAKLFTIDSYNTSFASSGVLISFSTRDQSDTNISGLIRINFQGSTAKGYVTVLSNGANPPSTSRTRFGAVLNASSKWEVWCSMETWSIISAQIISDRVSYGAHTNSTSAESPTGLTLFLDGVNLTKALGTSATGSTSVPIYAKADGTIEACTDDFARDSEVVTSVQKETVSNVTKLTYTKNGSKNDIVEFMTTAEAQLIWTNAKNAVAAS